MKNKEIEEVLDYYQKEIDKYEETKQYLIEKYGYDKETIDNISQHQKYKNNKLLLSYIEQLEKRSKQLENNRDKALKKLNKYRNRKDHYGLWCMEYIDNADIIHILKGDSDV